MNRCTKLALTTLALLNLGISFPAGDAVAQRTSIEEQLVGTWMLVSSTSIRPDGTKTDLYGPDPKGIIIYTSNGHFALLNSRADLPKLAANNRAQATAEEARAVVAGSIAYFGTYSVNEVDKAITVKIEGSTFVNMIGGIDQKRIITSLTADELKFINPRTPSGVTLEVVWKRAK
jgi:hypothetical protein